MTFKAVFPDILVRDRSGHGRPEASEAVSGSNILILPVDASAADLPYLHQLPPVRNQGLQPNDGAGGLGLARLPVLSSVFHATVREPRNSGAGGFAAPGAAL
jgi:hypothetical protein